MKPSKILNFFALFTLCVYSAIILIYFFCTYSIFPLWFSLGCFFLGIFNFLKSILFNNDSCFWLGITLILVGCIGIFRQYGLINQTFLICFYFLCPVISSIFCAILYKKPQHYKISFILILEDFWIMLYSNNTINLLWFIIFSIITSLICFRGIYVLARKRWIQQKTSKHQN